MADIFEAPTEDYISPRTKKCIEFFNLFNVSLLSLAIQTAVWVGWWNFLAYWAWPWDELYVSRDLVYIALGVILKVFGLVYFPEEEAYDVVAHEWSKGIPDTFSWRRKLKSFFVSHLHFISFLFSWVGMWNVFDFYIYACNYCWEREIFYIIIPVPFLFLTQELLSKESLYWLFSKGNPFRTDSSASIRPLLGGKGSTKRM